MRIKRILSVTLVFLAVSFLIPPARESMIQAAGLFSFPSVFTENGLKMLRDGFFWAVISGTATYLVLMAGSKLYEFRQKKITLRKLEAKRIAIKAAKEKRKRKKIRSEL